jgi:hypothetical protein
MARRKTQAAEAQEGAQADAAAAPDKLQQAKDKLARMEETQSLCFRHQNNLTALAEELRERKYKDFEITYLVEPKGPRNIPGYQCSEIERQKQFVNFLSARTKPAETHAAAIEQEPLPAEERGLGG